MKNIIIILIGLLFSTSQFAQTVTGMVYNNKNQALAGANVFWLNSSTGTTTDKSGHFEISVSEANTKKLVASYIGYIADTIEINNQNAINFVLHENTSIDEVVVVEQHDGIILSNNIPIKTENITQTELQKSACCDLAGCFETQLTVQPHTTNIITNSKELRILGLSGVYNQILIDGFPMIQGLTYTYGLSSYPGAFIDNIYVSKGANSVLQGYESISGQINVLMKEPEEADKLFLNAYVNSFSEKQFNASYAHTKNKWSNISAFHTTQPANAIDRDKDNFMDLPKLTRYMFLNKWSYGDDLDWGWSSKIALRYLFEQRIGGQISSNTEAESGANRKYRQNVHLNQPEIWTKTAYRFNDNHRVSLFLSSYYQAQESTFGVTKYNANQTSLYGNLQYDLAYAQKHNLKTGVSARYININEDISMPDSLQRSYAGNYEKVEKIPGVFAENTMSFFQGKVTWIAGIRGDMHNEFGFKITPRTLLKYDISEHASIRANFGTGWRTVNLFSENINLLASSRDIVFFEQLKPEKAINFGINFTQKFEQDDYSGYFGIDYYRTSFQNQFFPDYDSDPTKAFIKNFNGTSTGDGFQAEFFLKFMKRYELRAGYTFLDIYRIEEGRKQNLPFIAKHRVLTSVGFKPLSNKFHFDVTMHWNGEKRLPSTMLNPVEFQLPGHSKPYALVNAQLTYSFKHFEIYSGCENIFDFRQEQPILSWQDPYGPYFDTSFIWGPTKGREIYIGLRFKLVGQ